MQVSKVFNGSIAAAGSTSARVCSYGVTNTIATYQNRVDFVNQTIAGFLHDDCGADAAYEVRKGSAGKSLFRFAERRYERYRDADSDGNCGAEVHCNMQQLRVYNERLSQLRPYRSSRLTIRSDTIAETQGNKELTKSARVV